MEGELTTTPTYPGVYIEELPSSVRTIGTVTTSVTAFVGRTRRGPVDRPVTITSFADFERQYGGLDPQSPVSYAVQQFFVNGGTVAVIVRAVAAGTGKSATVTLHSTESSTETPVLEVTAEQPGAWGAGLRLLVDYDTTAPESTFNLRVFDVTGGVSEFFTGLSVTAGDPSFAETVVNSGSDAIRVKVLAEQRPDPVGTVSKPFAATLPDLTKQIEVKIGEVARTFRIYDAERDGDAPKTVTDLALLLERKLRALPDAPGKRVFAGTTVTAFGKRLQIVAGSTDPADTVRFVGEAANNLGLEAGVNPPVFALAGGEDGGAPGPTDLIGSEQAKSGIQALRDVQDVNLLALPEIAAYPDIEDQLTVLSAAQALAEEKRLFVIADAPQTWSSVDAARAGLSAFDPVRSDHTALYFPQLELVDPLTGRLRSFPPSGTVAGVYARTDAARGVWKAPAGTETPLSGVRALGVKLTDKENGLLNPLGLNCARSFPVVGPVVWGARTLAGSDALQSEWKYIPVRRLALFIEESLYRGLRWVVFEPNDERLWSQIRLNAEAYLQRLFQQGAFQGTTPRTSYFVKCDSTTTTQADIDRGVVNVLVGFAPVKPAEFVVVQIEQMAGQFEA